MNLAALPRPFRLTVCTKLSGGVTPTSVRIAPLEKPLSPLPAPPQSPRGATRPPPTGWRAAFWGGLGQGTSLLAAGLTPARERGRG